MEAVKNLVSVLEQSVAALSTKYKSVICWAGYVKRQNTTNVVLERTSNDGSGNKVRTSSRLRKTFSSPPSLTDVKKQITVSTNEYTSCVKDCFFNINSSSQLGSDTDNVQSRVEDVLDNILSRWLWLLTGRSTWRLLRTWSRRCFRGQIWPSWRRSQAWDDGKHFWSAQEEHR